VIGLVQQSSVGGFFSAFVRLVSAAVVLAMMFLGGGGRRWFGGEVGEMG